MSTRFTFRALVVGTALSLVISLGFSYARLALSTAGMSSDYIMAGAVFLFFALTVCLNPLLKFLRRSWGLDCGELVVVYTMLIIASAIPTWGFSGNMVPMLPGLYYFASAENNWIELLNPHVRSWMVISDPAAIEYFFEGLPEGHAVPWEAWIVPLAAWSSLVIAIYLMMIAAMVLVRRQWMEHERLIFPLIQLPLDMTAEDRRGRAFGPFARSPLMWVGFFIPFILLSTKGLNHYFPQVPTPTLYTYLLIFSRSTAVEILLSFPVLGLAYFLNLDVSLSLWLFHLLAKVQMGMEMSRGYMLPGEIEKFMEGTLTVAHQGMGAMFVLVFYGLWLGRGHLKAAFRKVLRGDESIDDRDEVLSYRAAALLLLGGGLYATAWLYASGIPLWVALIFLVTAFAIFYGITRVVAEGGLGFIRPQMTAQPIVINFLGTDAVTPAGIFSLGLSFSWAGNLRIGLMASAIHAMKLAERVGGLRRALFWAMVLAIVVSLFSSLWLVVWLAYQHGGINLDWRFYQYWGKVHAFAAYKIANPVNLIDTFDIIAPRLYYTGIGAVAMGGLIWARHYFLWWPTHYLGFAVSATNMTSASWFSIFLGWLIKAVVLKYGGMRLYRALRPLFLGFILAQITCSAFWALVYFLVGGTGNFVPVFTHHT